MSHPAYAGVSLALLHGSQPDVIVVCHEPGRERVLGHPHFALPSIEETIELALRLGGRTNPAIRCAGISLNTSALDAAAATQVIEDTAARVAAAGGRSDSRRRTLGAAGRRLPRMSSAAASPTRFQRLVLPGLAFKAAVIGGGYATGRELADYFLPSGPQGGCWRSA